MSTYRGFVRSDRKDSLSRTMLYSYRHQCGFHVSFVDKPGFARKFGAVTIPYGSADMRFSSHEAWMDWETGRRSGEGADIPPPVIEVPAGSAHYLEHCIFSRDEEGGLTGQLSAMGAQSNAWTSDSETVYYFTCVDHFNDILMRYFDAICNPSIDEARIAAEREIIGAELDMYEDDPDSVSYRTLLGQLYWNHGLREDVGGTRESIAGIGPEDLRNITDNFYTPAAMNLVIVGDFPEDSRTAVIDLLADYLDKMDITARGICHSPQEPASAARPTAELSMDIENESFMIGFKNAAVNGSATVNGTQWGFIQTAGQLFCDAIIGDTTPLHQDLYENSIINDSFEVQFTCGYDYNYIMITGESDDPEFAAREVARRFKAAVAGGRTDEKLFSILMKALHGDFVRSLDHIEACGMAAVEARLFDCDLFDHAAVYQRLNVADAADTVRFVLDEGSMAQLLLRRRSI